MEVKHKIIHSVNCTG